jgi:hypothetical protein
MKEYRFVNTLTLNLVTEWGTRPENTSSLLPILDEINELIDEDIQEEGGLAYYLDDRYPEAKEKVRDIRIGVMELEGEVVGLAVVRAIEELSQQGIEEIKDFLTGQYSDGWGEGFEQRPIKEWREEVEYEEYDEEEDDYYIYIDYENHELYLSFWSYKDWEIRLLEEREELIKVAPKKPVCKLIGENSNIFNLLAIARRSLLKEGLKQEAKEMVVRATSSNSYEEALGIIGEYVEII